MVVKMDTVSNMENVRVRKPKRLGDILVEAKLITPGQLVKAQELQSSQDKKLTEVLIEQKFISPEDLAATLSIQMNVPFINLKRHTIQRDALKYIPEQMARRFNVVPLAFIGDALIVVMENPGDIQVINDLVAQSGTKVQPAIGVSYEIRQAIDQNYKTDSEIEKEINRFHPKVAKQTEAESQISARPVEETPAMRTADLIIDQAIKDRASDIHFEPQHDRLRVRYRIDGVLNDVMSLPLSIHPALISRVKILASMNIVEKKRPQDGQFSVTKDGREVDIRVATSETACGELMVLRILDKSSFMLDLAQLGFSPNALEKYREILKSPFGMILIAGPTGAGKTTTLYSSISETDCKGLNIMTIEDPIEYMFHDISQIQVNPALGITFANGLRAIMRLDPDVILIGEMRDSDTANIGVQSALTGHLVFSSIHSNDATGAFFRLTNLGVDPYLISSSLLAVVAQRMVRRVCPHCRTLTERPVEEQLAYENILHEKRTKFYSGIGCNQCSNTGFLGRTGLFEILVMSERIKQMVVQGAISSDIKKQAMSEGMIPMIHDGMLKVRDGITTPTEVLRTVFYNK